jgi:hypothetical protein
MTNTPRPATGDASDVGGNASRTSRLGPDWRDSGEAGISEKIIGVGAGLWEPRQALGD